jgi:putative ABC transport system substrate-binding protein
VRRRDALKLIAVITGLIPRLAIAQSPRRLPIIGVPLVYARNNDDLMVALRKGLRDRGYVEGENIRIEHRFADGKLEKVPDLVRELVQIKVDIFIAGAEPTARIQMQLSPSTPIVLVAMGFDPVATGMIETVSRPGRNVTGIYARTGDSVAKGVELLKELRPGISNIAAYYDNWGQAEVKALEATASALSVRVVPSELSAPYDYMSAFSNARRNKTEGGIMTFSPRFYADRKKVASAALSQSFPVVSFDSSYPPAGGLLSYGPARTETWARAAYFIDRILRGDKPGELPLEEPRSYKMVVNLRTARSLGITVPESIMIRADEVIK